MSAFLKVTFVGSSRPSLFSTQTWTLNCYPVLTHHCLWQEFFKMEHITHWVWEESVCNTVFYTLCFKYFNFDKCFIIYVYMCVYLYIYIYPHSCFISILWNISKYYVITPNTYVFYKYTYMYVFIHIFICIISIICIIYSY